MQARNPRGLPILPRSGLYLGLMEYCDGRADPWGDAEYRHFVGQFAATWRRIPLWGRRSMLRYWRNSRMTNAPNIHVSEAGRGWDDLDALACTAMEGLHLRFHPLVSRMPDGVLQDLIAHELAHVYQWAAGRITRETDAEWNEIDADEIMFHGWGFDPDSIDDWAEKDGLKEFAGLPSAGLRSAPGAFASPDWVDLSKLN